jgi:hypothetical protein
MKLAIIFEVPDGQADGYADVASRLITHHAFAERLMLPHWSFDMEMRPVAAVLADPDLSAAAAAARSEVDQDHPWIPGAVFQQDERLKPALLALLDALT